VKSKVVLVALLAGCFVVACGRPASADDDKPTQWMKQKLEMSQNILSALTQGDFKSVEHNAQQMNVVNYLEKMVVQDQPHYKEYMRQLNVFETANRELLRQASAKNIEGATLAYTQLTVSCVQCHKLVRDAKK
jgi:cytochrome c556